LNGGRQRACTVTAAALALAATGAGCGTAGDRAQVRAVTERFYAAVGDKDGRRACTALAQSTIKQLQDQEKAPCPRAVEELDLSVSRVVAVQVFLTSARAKLADGESAFLDRMGASWKLSAVGCKAEEGKPRDRPFQCEVEA
jgi:hypothetical protein